MFLDKLLLINNIKSVYLNLKIFIPILIFLLFASYFDLKYKKIPNKLTLIFLIMRFIFIPVIGINLNSIYGLLFGFFIILIPAMIKNKPMGGDIKMMAILGFYLGIQSVFALLIGVITLSIMYYVPVILSKKEKKDVPLAPFVLISFILVSIISFFI